MMHGLFVCTIGWNQVEHSIVIKDNTTIQLYKYTMQKVWYCGLVDYDAWPNPRACQLSELDFHFWCLFVCAIGWNPARAHSIKKSILLIWHWQMEKLFQRLKFQISALSDICVREIYLSGFPAKQVDANLNTDTNTDTK